LWVLVYELFGTKLAIRIGVNGVKDCLLLLGNVFLVLKVLKTLLGAEFIRVELVIFVLISLLDKS
jgi:hypothetical protein